jgi:hypothetical protein
MEVSLGHNIGGHLYYCPACREFFMTPFWVFRTPTGAPEKATSYAKGILARLGYEPVLGNTNGVITFNKTREKPPAWLAGERIEERKKPRPPRDRWEEI